MILISVMARLGPVPSTTPAEQKLGKGRTGGAKLVDAGLRRHDEFGNGRRSGSRLYFCLLPSDF